MRSTLKQLFMAGAILIAPLAMAQEGKRGADKDPKAMAEAKTERMKQNLSLTDEQAGKVKAINMRHAEKMHAFKTEQQAEREQKKAAMMEIRDAHKAELREVLTPEQFEKMEAMREERGHGDKYKGRGQGGEKAPGKTPGRIAPEK